MLRNGSYGATAGDNGNGATEFFTYVSNVILTVLTEILRNLRNGNSETATGEWQRNGGNQALQAIKTTTAAVYKVLHAWASEIKPFSFSLTSGVLTALDFVCI